MHAAIRVCLPPKLRLGEEPRGLISTKLDTASAEPKADPRPYDDYPQIRAADFTFVTATMAVDPGDQSVDPSRNIEIQVGDRLTQICQKRLRNPPGVAGLSNCCAQLTGKQKRNFILVWVRMFLATARIVSFSARLQQSSTTRTPMTQ